MATYSELLKSPKWQRKRLEIMQRDNWACVNCNNSKDTLHVHHKKYIKGKKPWEYENSNLCTLCYICHEHEHFPKKVMQIMLEGVTSISVSELTALDYNSNVGYTDCQSKMFVSAEIKWLYKHLLEIKEVAASKFNKQWVDRNISKTEYISFLNERLNEKCLNKRVQITKNGKIIYG